MKSGNEWVKNRIAHQGLPDQVLINEQELNDLGMQGWELVSALPEVETVWPKEGSINVRPHGAVLIFKRAW